MLVRLKSEVTNRDWDGKTKDDYWRKAMSDLKLKVIEEFPSLINGWILRQSTKLSEPFVMFVDIREPENILSFVTFFENRSLYQVKTVLVEGKNSIRSENYSDRIVFNMNYDYCIKNYGDIDFLKFTAKTFVDGVILGSNFVRERK